MRALSGMLRKRVFHNRERLCARPEVRSAPLDQRRGRPAASGASGLVGRSCISWSLLI